MTVSPYNTLSAFSLMFAREIPWFLRGIMRGDLSNGGTAASLLFGSNPTFLKNALISIEIPLWGMPLYQKHLIRFMHATKIRYNTIDNQEW